MVRPRSAAPLWALILFCLTLAARADIRTGFGIESVSLFPLDTFFSDSRYQFIIPREEMRIEDGEVLNGLRLNLNQSSGHTFTLTIRVKSATQADLDSMAQGRFVNGGLTTIRSQTTSISSTPGWKNFFTSSFVLDGDSDLLVDLVMDKSTSGSDSFWRVAGSQDRSVYHGAFSPSPTFNLLGTTVPGQTDFSRPLVELIGPDRRMPPVVASAAQLLDPNGRIDADWIVSGRSSTILPGVTLEFGPGFGLLVQHDLVAQGTEQDSIRFTGDDWEGIVAVPIAGTRLLLDHCVIENTRNNGVGLFYQGFLSSRTTELRNLSIRGGDGGVALFAEEGKLVLEGVLAQGYGTGFQLEDLTRLSLERFSCLGNSQYGVYMDQCLADSTVIREGLVSGNTLAGMIIEQTGARIDRVTVADNDGIAFLGQGSTVIQLVNCVLDNPTANQEISADFGATIVASYSTVVGGAARCTQTSGALVLLGTQVGVADPQLDGAYHPLPGSPVIDAGSPLSTPDPDLTVADQGRFFFDQRAPLALSATDVPEDQGGRLQLVWNASSMDLAEVNRDNFYSVWRLDTLFSARTAALPVVYTRRQAELAIAEGRPFTWQRDGAAWNWLATVPAARFPQYALVVETLADRLDGQPWETPLKVLWHAQDVLAESATVYGTSVDNVPPDAPRALASTALTQGGMRLDWQPVTTGTVNGQALPERNGVVYRVYELPAPYAPPSSGVLLGTTADPTLLLPLPAPNQRRFFQVRADDRP